MQSQSQSQTQSSHRTKMMSSRLNWDLGFWEHSLLHPVAQWHVISWLRALLLTDDAAAPAAAFAPFVNLIN